MTTAEREALVAIERQLAYCKQELESHGADIAVVLVDAAIRAIAICLEPGPEAPFPNYWVDKRPI